MTQISTSAQQTTEAARSCKRALTLRAAFSVVIVWDVIACTADRAMEMEMEVAV